MRALRWLETKAKTEERVAITDKHCVFSSSMNPFKGATGTCSVIAICSSSFCNFVFIAAGVTQNPHSICVYIMYIQQHYVNALLQNIYTVNLGENLRRIRRAKNLSQDQLADLAGISRPTISMIESGKNAEAATINALAKALNVNVNELNAPNANTDSLAPYIAPTPKEDQRVYSDDEATFIKGRLDFWRRAYLKLPENERYKIIDAICAIYPEGLREVFIDWCKKP